MVIDYWVYPTNRTTLVFLPTKYGHVTAPTHLLTLTLIRTNTSPSVYVYMSMSIQGEADEVEMLGATQAQVCRTGPVK